MAWYLVFWRNRSTATVVPAASASQARSRAQRQAEAGLWGDRGRPPRQSPGRRLIRRGVWVRRRRDGIQPPVRQCSLQSQGPAAAQPLPAIGCGASRG